MRRRSGFGWLELVIGIVLIGLGVLAFARPDLALTGLVFAYGVAAVVMGVADLILFIQVERHTGFGPMLSLVSGVLSVMSGLMLAAFPGTGVIVLTVLFPIWFIAHCVSRLAHLGHIRFVAGEGIYWFTLIVNLIGLLMGVLMVFRPLFALSTLRFLAAAYLILLGVDSVVMAVSRMGMRR